MSSFKDKVTKKDFRYRLHEAISRITRLENQGSAYIGNNVSLSRLFTGQKLYVDTRDTSISPHIILDGSWEYGLSNLFVKLIQPNDTIMDIGADFGYYGVIGASKLSEDGHVIFMEANPIYEDYLAKNIALNGIGLNSSVFMNVVSSSSKGDVKFTILKDDWASSTAMTDDVFKTTRSVDYEVESIISVPLITIDEAVKASGRKTVDVIKMDIEGFEEQAISGMSKTIKSSPRLKLLIEFTSPAYKNPKKLFDKLKKDLPFIYLVNDADGTIKKISNYSSLKKSQNMILFAKEAVVI